MIVLVCAGLALTSCHQFTNPVDPNSTTFEGGTSTGDPDASTALPAVVRWESVIEHTTSQSLALEILDDDSFVEPRSPSDPNLISIVATFEKPADEAALKKAMYLLRVTDGVSVFTEVITPNELTPDGRRLIFQVWSPPTMVTVRIGIFDETGETVSECAFGLLRGDYDGNGVVEAADQTDGPGTYDGLLATSADERTIRSDMDTDGIVTNMVFGGSNDDGDVPNDFAGNALPANLPPPF